MEENVELHGFLTVVNIGTISCAIPLALWRMVVFKQEKLRKMVAVSASSCLIFCFIVTLYTDSHIYAALDLNLILYKYSHDFTSNAFALYSFYIISWGFLIFHQGEWKKLYHIFSHNFGGNTRLSTVAKIFLYVCPFKLILEFTDLCMQYHWKRKKFHVAIKYDFLIFFRQAFKFGVNWNKFVLTFIIITGLNIFRSHLRLLRLRIENIKNEHMADYGTGKLYVLCEKKRMDKLQSITDSYRRLLEGITCFNRIFGLSLFFFTTATSLIMVTTLHCLIIKKSYSIYRNIFFISSPLVDCMVCMMELKVFIVDNNRILLK